MLLAHLHGYLADSTFNYSLSRKVKVDLPALSIHNCEEACVEQPASPINRLSRWMR